MDTNDPTGVVRSADRDMVKLHVCEAGVCDERTSDKDSIVRCGLSSGYWLQSGRNPASAE